MTVKYNIKAVVYYVILFVLLFIGFFIKSPYIQVLQIPTLFILFVYIVLHFKRFDIFDGLVLLFSGYIILISALNHTLSFGILYALLLMATLPVFIRIELKKSNTILECIYVLSVVMTLLNFITILFPIGLDSSNHLVYLLGGKNALSMYQIPMIFYMVLYSYIKHNKLTSLNLLYIVLIIAGLVIGDSSTGVVAAILCILYLIFQKFIYFGHKIYLYSFFALQLIIINVSILYSITGVSDFITNVLGKDITFTGRTYLWGVAMKAIGESFFGYGRGNGIIASHSLFYECHSTILEILLTGGVILLAIFILIVFGAFSFKKTKKNKRLYHLSSFFLFVYLITGLTESNPFRIDLWIMFALIISMNSIITNEEKKRIIR